MVVFLFLHWLFISLIWQLKTHEKVQIAFFENSSFVLLINTSVCEQAIEHWGTENELFFSSKLKQNRMLSLVSLEARFFFFVRFCAVLHQHNLTSLYMCCISRVFYTSAVCETLKKQFVQYIQCFTPGGIFAL